MSDSEYDQEGVTACLQTTIFSQELPISSAHLGLRMRSGGFTDL